MDWERERQRPRRLKVRPGQRWRGGDGDVIVSDVRSESVWGQADVVLVRFYAVGADPVTGAVEEQDLDGFLCRFPELVD